MLHRQPAAGVASNPMLCCQLASRRHHTPRHIALFDDQGSSGTCTAYVLYSVQTPRLSCKLPMSTSWLCQPMPSHHDILMPEFMGQGLLVSSLVTSPATVVSSEALPQGLHYPRASSRPPSLMTHTCMSYRPGRAKVDCGHGFFGPEACLSVGPCQCRRHTVSLIGGLAQRLQGHVFHVWHRFCEGRRITDTPSEPLWQKNDYTQHGANVSHAYSVRRFVIDTQLSLLLLSSGRHGSSTYGILESSALRRRGFRTCNQGSLPGMSPSGPAANSRPRGGGGGSSHGNYGPLIVSVCTGPLA